MRAFQVLCNPKNDIRFMNSCKWAELNFCFCSWPNFTSFLLLSMGQATMVGNTVLDFVVALRS